MTCICAIEQDGIITMGGDSAGVAGFDVVIRKDEKVFTLKNSPNTIFGYTTSFRMGQLLRYALEMPEQSARKDDMQYLVTDFVDTVRGIFSGKGYMRKESDQEVGGTFLLGYNGHLYEVDSDFQIGIPADGYAACGCGISYALGSLHTSRSNSDPLERVQIALETAAKFSCGVRAPFTILQTQK